MWNTQREETKIYERNSQTVRHRSVMVVVVDGQAYQFVITKKGETQWQFTQVKNNKNERTNPFNSIFPSFDVSHLIHHSA
ncbi:hypothetical protein RDWZM_002644 [Blomia tropicalis]|uniref:Uncharacterized protein n=1 Tax=Blomia tropicalis TaxID=40697 RepID=A0A9Q0ME54_BLOTA|nr:hypothetical protein RDWZM_002644 [Blomia tropicalis]